MKREEIEAKIQEYASKLTTLTKPEDKRVKKRVLQALGKLKKQFADLPSQVESFKDGGSNIQSLTLSQPDVKTMTQKQLKMKLKLLNKELAEYSQKKQLKLARKRFAWGIKKGMHPDVHTYTNVLNTHVRCGDINGALEVFQTMRQNHVHPNIVTFTALLKGYSEVGHIAGAGHILFRCLTGRVKPNVRAVNTFLRGCTRLGAVTAAFKAFHLFRGTTIEHDTDDGGDEADENMDELYAADSSSYEYVISLLTQAFVLEEAQKILQSLPASGGRQRANEFKPSSRSPSNTQMTGSISHAMSSSGSGLSVHQNAAIYVCLCKAFALLGGWSEAEKWKGCAEVALEQSRAAPLREAMLRRASMTNGAENSSDERNSRSIQLFLQHRCTELERELQIAADFVARHAMGGRMGAPLEAQRSLHGSLVGSDGAAITRGAGVVMQRLAVLDALSRVVYFGFDGVGDCDPWHAEAEKKKQERKQGKQESDSIKYDYSEDIASDADDEDDDNDDDGESALDAIPAAIPAPSPVGGNEGKFSEGGHSACSGDRRDALLLNQVLALRDKFGLDRAARLPPDDGYAAADHLAQQRLLTKSKKSVVQKVLRCLDSAGHLDLQQLFAAPFTRAETSSTAAAAAHAVVHEAATTVGGFQRPHAAMKAKQQNLRGTFSRATAKGSWDLAHASSTAPAGSSDRDSGTARLPVKLEICSGSGEWVVAQAREDWDAATGQPRALWLALELRCDRVHDIFCRSVFCAPPPPPPPVTYAAATAISTGRSGGGGGGGGGGGSVDTSAAAQRGGISNLAILGGDAARILPQHFSPGSVDAVFINHPEPPERTGGTDDSEGRHLLTTAFLGEVHRILSAAGTLTIVTDNLPYAKSLLEALAAMARRHEAAAAAAAAAALAARTAIGGDEIGLGDVKGNGDNGSYSCSLANLPPAFVSVPMQADADEQRMLQEEVVGVSGDYEYTAGLAPPKITATGHKSKHPTGSDVGSEAKGKRKAAAGNSAQRGVQAASSKSKRAKIAGVADVNYFSDDEGGGGHCMDGSGGTNDDSGSDSDSDSDSDSYAENDVKVGISSNAAASWGSFALAQSVGSVKTFADRDSDGNRSDKSAAVGSGSCGGFRLQLWRAASPGPGAGHIASASSYFDRMWDLGSKKRRWFLFVQKK